MERMHEVTVPPTSTLLTTLARVKLELNITANTWDTILTAKIGEASSDIMAHLRRDLPRQTLRETLWSFDTAPAAIVLENYPVVSITSAVIDDVTVDSDEYRINKKTGKFHRLDSAAAPDVWVVTRDIVIIYVAGYIMPGETNRDLPMAIESACVELVQSFWFSRGRDPSVRAEDIPGLGSTTYWVGAVGESGELPPSVLEKIAPFRRAVGG